MTNLAGEEVGKRISGGRGSRLECEDSEVVQIAHEHSLVERQLATEDQTVLALGHRDHVAERIEVRSRHRTGQRTGRVKVSRDVEVRQS